MSIEIKTSEIAEIEKFVHEHADSLSDKQIAIKTKDGSFVAELFDTNEPST
jgi:hypothetical protein